LRARPLPEHPAGDFEPLCSLLRTEGLSYDLGTNIRTATTDQLSAEDVASIRALLFAAFKGDEHGGFSADDWQHSIGGVHFVVEEDGRVVGHASVVERDIHVGGRPFRTGYVEAVATDPARQRRGIGTVLMLSVNEHIATNYVLGALGTGSQPFYERIGWVIWRGPSYVRTEAGEIPTPDEDGYIMVLRTQRTPDLDLDASISCEWRPGDVW
jgi:aminoglycoside 2'-N-acetyltransferase I